MPSPLKPEFEWYLAHKAELLKKFNGKFVVIKNRQVIGAYKAELEAVQETRKAHALGTFLVQKVEPGDAAYTQTFNSRVSFASENA
jgi:hypothetical protein